MMNLHFRDFNYIVISVCILGIDMGYEFFGCYVLGIIHRHRRGIRDCIIKNSNKNNTFSSTNISNLEGKINWRFCTLCFPPYNNDLLTALIEAIEIIETHTQHSLDFVIKGPPQKWGCRVGITDLEKDCRCWRQKAINHLKEIVIINKQ